MSAIERVAETNPIWWPTSQEESGPAAEGRYDVDLVVIGEGLAGQAAAYYVTEYRPELAVGVVEAKHVGAGATGGRYSSCPARVSRTVATKTNIYRGRRGDICVRALTFWSRRIR
jgi:hypothetical protein